MFSVFHGQKVQEVHTRSMRQAHLGHVELAVFQLVLSQVIFQGLAQYNLVLEF